MSKEDTIVTHPMHVDKIEIDGDLTIDSKTEVDEGIRVTGSVFINNELIVNGEVQIGGFLYVKSKTQINGEVLVYKSVSVNAPIVITENLVVKGDANVNESLHVRKDLEVMGNLQASSKESSLFIGNSLLVKNNINTKCTLSVTDNIKIGGGTLNGTIVIGGDILTKRMTRILTKDFNLGRDIVANGSIFIETINVKSKLIVRGNMRATHLTVSNGGEACIAGCLIVKKSLVVWTVLTVGSECKARDLKVHKDADVRIEGDIEIDKGILETNIHAKEATYKSMTHTNDFVVTSPHYIKADLEVHGKLVVNNVLSVNSSLIVQGNAVINNRHRDTIIEAEVEIDGNLEVTSPVIIKGETVINGSLYVTFDGSLNLYKKCEVDANLVLDGTMKSINTIVSGSVVTSNDLCVTRLSVQGNLKTESLTVKDELLVNGKLDSKNIVVRNAHFQVSQQASIIGSLYAIQSKLDTNDIFTTGDLICIDSTITPNGYVYIEGSVSLENTALSCKYLKVYMDMHSDGEVRIVNGEGFVAGDLDCESLVYEEEDPKHHCDNDEDILVCGNVNVTNLVLCGCVMRIMQVLNVTGNMDIEYNVRLYIDKYININSLYPEKDSKNRIDEDGYKSYDGMKILVKNGIYKMH